MYHRLQLFVVRTGIWAKRLTQDVPIRVCSSISRRFVKASPSLLRYLRFPQGSPVRTVLVLFHVSVSPTTAREGSPMAAATIPTRNGESQCLECNMPNMHFCCRLFNRCCEGECNTSRRASYNFMLFAFNFPSWRLMQRVFVNMY